MKIETSAPPVFVTSCVDQVPHPYHAFCTNWAGIDFRRFEFGDLLTQHFSCTLFTIYYFRFRFHRHSELEFFSPQSAVCLQVNLQARFGYMSPSLETGLVEAGHYGLLYLNAGRHKAIFEAGEYELYHIELAPQIMADMAEARSDIKILQQAHQEQLSTGKRLSFLPVNYMVRDTVNNIRWCSETGGGLVMDLKTSLLSLLNLYRKGLNQLNYVKSLKNAPYQQTLLKIMQEVTIDPNKLQHSVSYFARKHNLSESTLKRAFKAYFKIPLASFVTGECMKKGAWLSRNDELSIDDIAFEVGYAEKSGFIRAFKRYFGKTPKQLQE